MTEIRNNITILVGKHEWNREHRNLCASGK